MNWVYLIFEGRRSFATLESKILLMAAVSDNLMFPTPLDFKLFNCIKLTKLVVFGTPIESLLTVTTVDNCSK